MNDYIICLILLLRVEVYVCLDREEVDYIGIIYFFKVKYGMWNL